MKQHSITYGISFWDCGLVWPYFAVWYLTWKNDKYGRWLHDDVEKFYLTTA
jgi:hypothetical protein